MALAYLAFGYGLRMLSAATATTLTLFEPLVATLLAIVVVGERLSHAGWVGFGLVGAGLVIITTSGIRARAAPMGTKAPNTVRSSVRKRT